MMNANCQEPSQSAKDNSNICQLTRAGKAISPLPDHSPHDKVIKSTRFTAAMLTTVSSFDNRIKLIEENQHRIANSLSRFLDKMNQLLFKENNGGKKAEGESLGLCKTAFPNFVEDIMSQIGSILFQSEEDFQNESSSLVVTSANDQFKEAVLEQVEHEEEVLSEQKNKLNQSFNSISKEEISQDCNECLKQKDTLDSVEVKSIQKSASKYSNSKIYPKSNPYQQENIQRRSTRESLAGSQTMKKQPTTPISNLSTSNSQAAFQQQTNKSYQGKKKNDSKNNMIDFYPREKDMKILKAKNKDLEVQSDTKSKSKYGIKPNEARDKSNNSRLVQQTKKGANSLSQSAVKVQTKGGKVKEIVIPANPQILDRNFKQARSPRGEIANHRNTQSSQTPRINPPSTKDSGQRLTSSDKKLNGMRRVSQSPQASSRGMENFDRPSQVQIQNNILVVDQSPSRRQGIQIQKMGGDVLDCIAEFIGDDIPLLVLTNKSILKTYTEYQIENLSLQGEMIQEQIEELKLTSSNYHQPSESAAFILPEELEERVEILEDKGNWEKLLKDIVQSKLSLKEVTVIRIYFTFLNFKNTSPSDTDSQAFLRIVQQHVKKHLQDLSAVNNAEKSFKFTEDIKYRAMELMMKVDLNELLSAKFCPLVEAMLFVIVEAVSHLDNLPKGEQQGEDNEINTLEFVKEAYQEKLEKVEKLRQFIS